MKKLQDELLLNKVGAWDSVGKLLSNLSSEHQNLTHSSVRLLLSVGATLGRDGTNADGD